MNYPRHDPYLPGLVARLSPSLKKVAVFRASRLGDHICATPAFRALRQAVPGARMTLIGLPMIETLARKSPYLDDFIPFPGAPGIAEQLFNPARLAEFYDRVRSEHFDLVIQIHGSGFYSNPIALEFRARTTVGFIRPGDDPGGLDAAFPFPCREHEIQKLLSFCNFLGVAAQGSEPEFPLDETDHAAAEALLPKDGRPLLGLHADAEEVYKRWSPKRFAETASLLAESCEGTVVILGSKRPEGVDEVHENLTVRRVDLRGRTTLGSLGAVISRVALLVTNDSGPAHIAYALGTKSVTVFGGTQPSEWGSTNEARHRLLFHPIDCRPCQVQRCPIDFRCLRKVFVSRAVEAGLQLLRAT